MKRKGNMKSSGKLCWNVSAKLLVALICLSALVSCSQPGLIRPVQHARPELERVGVKSCYLIDGVTYCEIERDPLLRNDSALKSEVIYLRTSAAWANPDPINDTRTSQ